MGVPSESGLTFVLFTGRNTLLCRMVHQNMVPIRPSVHCPHIGQGGGGYCDDDMSYMQTVTEPYFTNYPFEYGCEKDAVGVGRVREKP